MKKFIRSRLPSAESIKKIRWLQPISHWLHHPNLWHLHRRSVAGGCAIGLFCGLVPGPLQMLSAAWLAIWLRVNLPVALITTFYTNPLTIVPLYYFAYEIGLFVMGAPPSMSPPLLPELHWLDWFNPLLQWVTALSKPLLVGLPILAISLSLLGYLSIRLIWRLVVMYRWRKRHRVGMR